MGFQFFNVVSTLFSMLEEWSWAEPSHVAVFGYFMVGCVAQFVLLKKRWRPWLIPLVLLVVVVVCECAVAMSGNQDLLIFELFFAACLLGAATGCIAYVFWETVKKKKPNWDTEDPFE